MDRMPLNKSSAWLRGAHSFAREVGSWGAMLAFFGGVLLVVLRSIVAACKEVERFAATGDLPVDGAPERKSEDMTQ